MAAVRYLLFLCCLVGFACSDEKLSITKEKREEVNGLIWQGNLLLRKGDFDSAVVVFDKVIRDSPGLFADAYFLKANIYFRRAKFKKALKYYALAKQAADFQPKFSHYGDEVNVLTSLGRYDAAVILLDEMLQLFPAQRDTIGLYRENVVALRDKLINPQNLRYSMRASTDLGSLDELYLRCNLNADGSIDEVNGWKATPVAAYKPKKIKFGNQDFWLWYFSVKKTAAFPYVCTLEREAKAGVTYPVAYTSFHVRSTFVREIRLRSMQTQIKQVPLAKRPTGDKRKRLLVVFLDGGSLSFINPLVYLNEAPHLGELIRTSVSTEMISTSPPITALVMQAFETFPESQKLTWYQLVLAQLKGIPFVDRWIKDELIAPKSKSSQNLWSHLDRNSKRAINLFYNDPSAYSQIDEGDRDGYKRAPETALESKAWDLKVEASAAKILNETLGVDEKSKPALFSRLADQNYLLRCLLDTQKKSDRAAAIWSQKNPDLLLVRFPAVDMVSHSYFSNDFSYPLQRPIDFAYRQIDRIIGNLMKLLDQDDAFMLISDHGVTGHFSHDRRALFVLNHPANQQKTTIRPMPVRCLQKYIYEVLEVPIPTKVKQACAGTARLL